MAGEKSNTFGFIITQNRQHLLGDTHCQNGLTYRFIILTMPDFTQSMTHLEASCLASVLTPEYPSRQVNITLSQHNQRLGNYEGIIKLT